MHVDVQRDAARAVAALGRDAAVRVADFVAQVTARKIALVEYENLIAANAEVPVRDAFRLSGFQPEPGLARIDQHEVIARSVHLVKFKGAAHGLSTCP